MDNFEFENKKKKKLRRQPIYIGICILCLVVGLFGGYALKTFVPLEQTVNQDSLYNQVAETIGHDFLDTTESDKSIQERMLAGMIAALGDNHSSYLSLKQSTDLETSINGSFQGVGLTFVTISAGALVLDVYQNTPASQAGILAGDIITHVQGTSIAGYTSEKIKKSIQGEKDTEVSLRLLRNGKSIDVKAIRNSVEISVNHEIRTKGNMKIGYLGITTFGEGSATLIEEGLKNFKSQGVENIVIDLRDNGGGYLEAAKDILNLFIDSGNVMIKVQPKQGEEDVYKATKRQKYHFNHGYILVNGGSASASEVMTAALKETLDYKVVGTTTYGKGTVQTQKVLSDSSVIKYTRAKWLTPNGVWVNEKGIEPDYKAENITMDNFNLSELKESYQYDQVNVHIQYMQEMLSELNYKVDRKDGYFSKATETALKSFEKKYGLKSDGIYQKDDATILLSALSYHVYHETQDTQYQKVLELIK